MGKNDFSAEVAENYEEKCLCVLVLDTSGSMNEVVGGEIQPTGETRYIDGKLYQICAGGITKLNKLQEGLQRFYEDVQRDETACKRLEIAILAFNDSVQLIQSPSLVENVEFPQLEASGNTAMVDAVYEAIELVTDRKNWYKSTEQKYYRPWIILMTDGEPNEDQNVDSLAQRIKQDTNREHKKYVFLPIGVDNANMQILDKIHGDIPAMKLKDAEFNKFFKWLSASMSSITSARPGQKVDLSSEDSPWWEIVQI